MEVTKMKEGESGERRVRMRQATPTHTQGRECALEKGNGEIIRTRGLNLREKLWHGLRNRIMLIVQCDALCPNMRNLDVQPGIHNHSSMKAVSNVSTMHFEHLDPPIQRERERERELPAPNLPQGQASRFPHGRLGTSNSLRYPHYDEVNQRW